MNTHIALKKRTYKIGSCEFNQQVNSIKEFVKTRPAMDECYIEVVAVKGGNYVIQVWESLDKMWCLIDTGLTTFGWWTNRKNRKVANALARSFREYLEADGIHVCDLIEWEESLTNAAQLFCDCGDIGGLIEKDDDDTQKANQEAH